MGIASTACVPRQLNRLFRLGSVGTMTDAQLLESFASRSDEIAEAAFEELVIRHGPMVLRVCRGVLHDAHDAEDAFQAVFLILAHRASSVRRRASVASWLHGVARRVASRARSEAARRRARDARAAMTIETSYVTDDDETDCNVFHDEIDRLPERLRGVVTLCCLEGLTYAAAACQLGVSVGTVRGRVARARDRLRRRLTARGVAVPAALVAAGAGQAQAAIPAILARSAIRVALGCMSGASARSLARGVLSSMLLDRLKIAAVLLTLVIAGRDAAWAAVGAFIGDDRPAVSPPPFKNQAAPSAAALAPRSKTTPPAVPYRLSGTVRIEETGELVAGVKLRVNLGAVAEYPSPIQRIVETGADGRFVVDLPAGPFQVHLTALPAGHYWVHTERMDSLHVGPDLPAVHREYRLRKGTTWAFQFTNGPGRTPPAAFVWGRDLQSKESIDAQADEAGHLPLTLPGDGTDFVLDVRESPWFSAEFDTGTLQLRLKCDPGFRPDELKAVSLMMDARDGFRLIDQLAPRKFRLIDTDGKSATLFASVEIEPIDQDGRLFIRVALPHRESDDFGAITGQVLDDKGRPIPGVLVGLVTKGNRVSDELRHHATTNAEGRYRLRDIPRRGIDGRRLSIEIVAAKAGFAGVVSPPVTLSDRNAGRLQDVDPIRLEPGTALHGIVVNHRGWPVAGARMRSDKHVPYVGLSENMQTATTDENGRFTLRDLRRGIARLRASDGISFYADRRVLVGASETVLFQLPEERPGRDVPRNLLARAEPLRGGQAAPEWQVEPWSDGQAHAIADDRGKPVLLYFWGIDFKQSVEALPAMGRLAAHFERRGVMFRAIHRPDKDVKRTEEDARHLLALRHAPVIFALDQFRLENHSRGMTAQQYGVNNYPVVILIDRAGKIAFRSDIAAGDQNVGAVFMKILTEPEVMTEEKANRIVEQGMAQEIEAVLKPAG